MNKQKRVIPSPRYCMWLPHNSLRLASHRLIWNHLNPARVFVVHPPQYIQFHHSYPLLPFRNLPHSLLIHVYICKSIFNINFYSIFNYVEVNFQNVGINMQINTIEMFFMKILLHYKFWNDLMYFSKYLFIHINILTIYFRNILVIQNQTNGPEVANSKFLLRISFLKRNFHPYAALNNE